MASSHSTPIARRLGAGAAAALLLGSSLIVTAASAGSVLAALPSAGSVQVSAAVHHDVSPPLRGMAPASPSARKLTEQPIRLTGRTYPNMPDGALQGSATTFAATTAGIGFAGVGQGDYGFSDQYAPPDTNGAVGATQYVQWVNTAFAVFDKTTGTKILGPVAGNTLWSGFGGGCQTNNNGDPIVQYDKAAQRWILTQFSISTTPYLQCVAVSTTSDATGSYNRYAFSYGNTNFNDYPKLGVWPDGYYLSANIFLNGSSYAGPMVCAYNRTAMLAGAAATQQCFQISNSYGPVLPADLDGKQAPPAGTPEMFLGYGSSSLDLWKFHVDWTTPTNTKLSGPTVIPVASFSAACNGGTCIPQSGTSQKLDSLADRVMYRLAYRNFGDHEALVVNHSVTAGTSTGIRWYELRNAAGQTMASAAPVVNQQGTYAPDASYRWMGSIAMDGSGDIAVGYSVSSSSMFPSIAYASRVPGDAAGTLSTEVTVKAGGGSQLANLSRWGDYSAMTVDPVDDCTFWYTNEYLKASGTFNWSTWITSFKFPGCGVQQTLTSIAVSPASAKVLTGASQQYTATARDQSGNPMATQPAFTWSVTGGGSIGASGLFTAGSSAGGPFTVTATSSGVIGTASVTVTAPPVLTTITVAPASASVQTGGTQQFTATGYDQFSNPLSPQPTFTWSVSGGGLFTAGLFTAGSTAGGPFTVTAASGSVSGTAQVKVTSPPVLKTIVVSPSSATVPVGGTQQFTATGYDQNGVVLATQPTIAWSVNGGGNISGGLFTSGSTAGGPFTVTAASGLVSGTASVTVVQPDFSLSASPTSRSIKHGQSTSYSVTITRLNGFAGTVSFTASGLPAGATYAFSPSSTSGTSATLSVSTSGNSPKGTYILTISGTSGSLAYSITVSLTIR